MTIIFRLNVLCKISTLHSERITSKTKNSDNSKILTSQENVAHVIYPVRYIWSHVSYAYIFIRDYHYYRHYLYYYVYYNYSVLVVFSDVKCWINFINWRLSKNKNKKLKEERVIQYNRFVVYGHNNTIVRGTITRCAYEQMLKQF